MADLQRRGGSYVSRSTREKRAYAAARVGTVSGGLFLLTAVLAVVGVIGWAAPVVLALITGLAGWRFSRATGRR